MKFNSLMVMLSFAVTACTPADQLVGTFAFSLSGTDTNTAPNTTSTNPTGTGSLAITQGVATDYVMVIAQTDTSPCTLTGSKASGKPNVITIGTGQTCQFAYPFGSVKATLNTGSVTLDTSTMNTATLAMAYSYAGQVFNINYAGTGNRTYAGPRF